MSGLPVLYTVTEVAKSLRISTRWVSQLLREGALKGTQLGVGGSWRVNEEDLGEFLRSRGGAVATTPMGEMIFLYIFHELDGPIVLARWHGRTFRFTSAEELKRFVRDVGADGFAKPSQTMKGAILPVMELRVPGVERIAEGVDELFKEAAKSRKQRNATLVVHETRPETVAERIQKWQRETGARPVL